MLLIQIPLRSLFFISYIMKGRIRKRSAAVGPSCWPCPFDSWASPPPAAGPWGWCKAPCAPCKNSPNKTRGQSIENSADRKPTQTPQGHTHSNDECVLMKTCTLTHMLQQKKKTQQKTISKQKLALWQSSPDKERNVLHRLCGSPP